MESISILQLQDSNNDLMESAELLAVKNEDSKVSDVQTLLAHKERDLILAAELGKALLEKNEDLSQQNEKMAEDFSKQLEVRLCCQHFGRPCVEAYFLNWINFFKMCACRKYHKLVLLKIQEKWPEMVWKRPDYEIKKWNNYSENIKCLLSIDCVTKHE